MTQSFLDGVFSAVGRTTHIQINKLREQCQVDAAGNSLSPEQLQAAANAKVRFVADDKSKQDESLNKGALARAIMEKLQMKTNSFGSDLGKDDSTTRKLRSRAGSPDQQRLQPAFKSQGFDSPMTSKFTAANTSGIVSRFSGQRPDPGQYQVQWNSVLGRIPACDFQERPRHRSRSHDSASPRSLPGSRAESPNEKLEMQRSQFPVPGARVHSSSFVTSVDLADDLEEPDWRRTRREALTSTATSLHIFGLNQVSEPPADLTDQHAAAYRHLRSPTWDFAKNSGRKSVVAGDASLAPGKYDIHWSSLQPEVKTGVPFYKTLSRDAACAVMGHFTATAALLPKDRRSPGGVLIDRSWAKDGIRTRARSVSNFRKDTPRQELWATPEQMYVDDPAVESIVLERQLSFDVISAECTIRSRASAGTPLLEKMVPRGKGFVRGIKDLPDLPHWKSAVGHHEPAPLRDPVHDEPHAQSSELFGGSSRMSKSGMSKKCKGGFDFQTQYQPTLAYNNFNHGHAPVRGAGPAFESKLSGRKRQIALSFIRKGLGPGFSHGTEKPVPQLDRQHRSYHALPNWQNEIVASADA